MAGYRSGIWGGQASAFALMVGVLVAMPWRQLDSRLMIANVQTLVAEMICYFEEMSFKPLVQAIVAIESIRIQQ